MSNPFRYQLGDLVEFEEARVMDTLEYTCDAVLTGIVIKQRYVFTADNRFLVRTPHTDYWVGADKLKLISKGTK